MHSQLLKDGSQAKEQVSGRRENDRHNVTGTGDHDKPKEFMVIYHSLPRNGPPFPLDLASVAGSAVAVTMDIPTAFVSSTSQHRQPWLSSANEEHEVCKV